MTVALGTSTPTSTTVVETRTSVAPSRKAAMASSFSPAPMRPWRSPTARPGRTEAARVSAVWVAEWRNFAAQVACSGTSSSSEPSSASSTRGHMT